MPVGLPPEALGCGCCWLPHSAGAAAAHTAGAVAAHTAGAAGAVAGAGGAAAALAAQLREYPSGSGSTPNKGGGGARGREQQQRAWGRPGRSIWSCCWACGVLPRLPSESWPTSCSSSPCWYPEGRACCCSCSRRPVRKGCRLALRELMMHGWDLPGSAWRVVLPLAAASAAAVGVVGGRRCSWGCCCQCSSLCCCTACWSMPQALALAGCLGVAGMGCRGRGLGFVPG